VASKNKFSSLNNQITISREGWSKLAMITFRDDYATEITKYTWGEKNGYLWCKRFGYLHRYIVEKWYGKDVLDEMTQKGFIVDHMDNDGFNCGIENLCFLHKDENTAKGFTVDKKRNALRHRIALSLFRDFTTGCFQTTMFFNEPAILVTKEGQFNVSVIKLLYSETMDYRIVINDAKSVLDNYEISNQIDFLKLNHIDMRFEKSIYVVLTQEEIDAGACLVHRDGKTFLVLRAGTTLMRSVGYDEGWKPNEEMEGEINGNPNP